MMMMMMSPHGLWVIYSPVPCQRSRLLVTGRSMTRGALTVDGSRATVHGA